MMQSRDEQCLHFLPHVFGYCFYFRIQGYFLTLSDDLDALGMPRVALDWQLTSFDKRSIRRFYELLGREIGRAGLGRVQLADWLAEGDDDSWPSFLSGGWHHM